MRITPILASAGMIAFLLTGVGTAQQPPAAGNQTLPERVDTILTRLESRKVTDLHAKVTWKLSYGGIEEESEDTTKLGDLWYKDVAPVPKFRVHFTEKEGGRSRRKIDEQHMFDGHWYVELQAATKTVTQREIRPPGATTNPYKIGEGAFPLPFGQKKADILHEFDVTLVPPGPGDPKEPTDHLHLVPRAGTRTGRTYKVLDFWVAREGPAADLPIVVKATKKGEDTSAESAITITFEKIELNTGFSASKLDVDVPAGYEKIVEKYEDIEPPAAEGEKVKR